jgi:hypothetical protein
MVKINTYEFSSEERDIKLTCAVHGATNLLWVGWILTWLGGYLVIDTAPLKSLKRLVNFSCAPVSNQKSIIDYIYIFFHFGYFLKIGKPRCSCANGLSFFLVFFFLSGYYICMYDEKLSTISQIVGLICSDKKRKSASWRYPTWTWEQQLIRYLDRILIRQLWISDPLNWLILNHDASTVNIPLTADWISRSVMITTFHRIRTK